MKKIAVIGSGFFGTLISLHLSKKFKVDLFEKNSKFFYGASSFNQMRYHLGYHYPRSKKTVNELKLYEKQFKKFFGEKVLGKTINYYGISKKKSKVNFKKYLKFLVQNKLKFKKINLTNFSNNIEGAIISNERNLDLSFAKKIIKKKIKNSRIKILLNRTLQKKNIDQYYKIIICAYDQNNVVLKNLGIKPKKRFRYELIEKILIKLPKEFMNKSYIILDGKFVCVDPLLNTGYHLISDNLNSKIEIKKGYYPSFKNEKKKFLHKGFIINKKISKFDSFVKNGSKYLNFIKYSKFISTSFVTRVVEINKEDTDERTNSIEVYNNKIFTILSGKWNTSVGIAKRISKILDAK